MDTTPGATREGRRNAGFGRYCLAACPPLLDPVTSPDPVESAADATPPRRLNSFQLLGAVLSAAVGVRGVSKRGNSVSDASTGAILGAILIFCAVLGLGMYAFVHAIRSSIAG